MNISILYIIQVHLFNDIRVYVFSTIYKYFPLFPYNYLTSFGTSVNNLLSESFRFSELHLRVSRGKKRHKIVGFTGKTNFISISIV